VSAPTEHNWPQHVARALDACDAGRPGALGNLERVLLACSRLTDLPEVDVLEEGARARAL
jgi:hypothetical protein